MDAVLDVCPNRAWRRLFAPAEVEAAVAGQWPADVPAVSAPIDQPPAAALDRRGWAAHHGLARAVAKRRRDFTSADAIRAALAAASVQLRDAKDGSVEVVVES
jgi:hypothetical protein